MCPQPLGAVIPGNALQPLLAHAGRVTHVQVAVDGGWEDAIRFSALDVEASLAALSSILRPRGEVAVEVFAADGHGCQTFIGVRFPAIEKVEAIDLVRALHALAATESITLPDVATWVAVRTGEALFEGGSARVEIGVVDAWSSLGTRDISIAAGGSESDVRAAILTAVESLRALPQRRIALELAFASPIQHWVGVEVARAGPGGVVASESISRVIGALSAHV